MRERLQAWAPYSFGVGFALWVSAVILKLIGQPDERVIALLVAGLVFFALFVYARPGDVRQAVTSRGARYGSNALLISAAFIGIIILVDFLGSRYHVREDLTANKTFTLSPLTVNVLKGLKEPVQAIAFYTSLGQNNRQQTEDLLKEYANETANFTYRFVDPQAEPQVARDYKVQFDGTVVLERGTRRENVQSPDEQGLTNGIVKVSEDTQPTIYFTTGHGEHSPSDSGNNGLSLMQTAMEQENYKVSTINLTTITNTLPADTTALVIAGPQQAFQPQEVKIVKDYLDKNGRVIIMLDPQTNAGLDDILTEWGLKLNNDEVFDPTQGFFGQAQVPVVDSYPSHAVTQDLTGMSTFFPGVRSLEATNPAPTGKTLTALLTTSSQSWGETDFNSIKDQSAKFDAGTDLKGPLNIAYAAQGTGTTPPELIVIGNSTFITNGTLTARITVGGQQQQIQSGNALIFGNSLHWMAGQENLIAIPPKPQDSHPIFLTGAQSSFVFWSSFLFIPFAILIVGGLVWWRRR